MQQIKNKIILIFQSNDYPAFLIDSKYFNICKSIQENQASFLSYA